MGLSYYLRHKADNIEDFEFRLKYHYKPLFLKLFGGFWDIRKRPRKPTKSLTLTEMSNLIRKHFNEDTIQSLCYKQSEIIKWLNKGQQFIGEKDDN